MILKYTIGGLACLFLVFIIWMSCTEPPVSPAEEKEVIAEVGNRRLYRSELENLIHPSVSPYDSSALANAYIDQWIKDQLLMSEAAKYYSTDPDIEKLVSDYREKLIKFNFEEKILEERYDTVITDKELAEFYEMNKEQFLLDKNIYRCIFAAVPRSWDNRNIFRTAWQRGDIDQVAGILEGGETKAMLNDSVWNTWADISSWSEVLSNEGLMARKDLRLRDGDIEIYLKVLETKNKESISPLAYIEFKLKQMMLHQRKQKVIQDYKQELYEEALDRHIIKI